MSVVEEILEKIEKLTLIEAAELVKAMEEKFGVSAAAPVAVAAAAPAADGGAAPAAEEASEVTVVLVSAGANKLNVIKEVKAITGGGLTETKQLVDSAPSNLKEKVKREEAEQIKAKLEELGATVELK